jgi:hypothetical protein
MIQADSRIPTILMITILIVTLAAFEIRLSIATTVPYSLVGQSNTDEDTAGQWIRHNFWASGRHWVWWATNSPGGSLVYATSTDGVHWSSATQILGPSIGSETDAAIWFNGTNVFYAAFNAAFYGSPLVYRMGIPNSNGTITWVAPQQQITTQAPIYVDIKTDSKGYVWVTYMTETSPDHAYAIRNLRRDGAWQNGTVYQLDQFASFIGWLPPDIVPLTNGKMYFVYNSNTCASGGIFGRYWNGTALQPQETITSQCPTAQGYSSAVAIGDTVYLAFGEVGGSVHFNRRFTNGTWTPDLLLQSSGNTTQVSMSVNGTNNLIVFWQGGNPANTVFYRIYNVLLNSWSQTVAWFVDPEGFTLVVGSANIYSRPGSFYSDFGNSSVRYIGFQYSTKNSTPYNVKYAFLAFPVRQGTALFKQIFPSVNVTA